VARDVAASLPMAVPVKPRAILSPADDAQSDKAEQKLRQTMAADVGVVRDAGSLTNALLTICALERDAQGDRRLGNMLSTAKLIAAAALQREESRGAQFRSDYPMPDEELAERSFLTLADADAIANEAAKSRAEPAELHAAPARAALHA
jgi:L-aspartate oxidase